MDQCYKQDEWIKLLHRYQLHQEWQQTTLNIENEKQKMDKAEQEYQEELMLQKQEDKIRDIENTRRMEEDKRRKMEDIRRRDKRDRLYAHRYDFLHKPKLFECDGTYKDFNDNSLTNIMINKMNRADCFQCGNKILFDLKQQNIVKTQFVNNHSQFLCASCWHIKYYGCGLCKFRSITNHNLCRWMPWQHYFFFVRNDHTTFFHIIPIDIIDIVVQYLQSYTSPFSWSKITRLEKKNYSRESSSTEIIVCPQCSIDMSQQCKQCGCSLKVSGLRTQIDTIKCYREKGLCKGCTCPGLYNRPNARKPRIIVE